MDKKIVCLGGGVGTVQVLRAVRSFSRNITVVVSMADDGGSAGRLRRLYSVPPPGDLINCIAALSDAEPTLRKLLTYRFEGDRWGRPDSIGGHKIGNFILVALTKILGDFNLALEECQRIFNCHGRIIPTTFENVSIWAETTEGKKVIGEETIDLGKYRDNLYKVHLNPENVSTPQEVIESLSKADLIITGPGDVYTTILPVLLVPQIYTALKKAKGKKLFILNIANKRETENYTIVDHLEALRRHCPDIHFDTIIVNKNQTVPFPAKLHYKYIPLQPRPDEKYGKISESDIIDTAFPVQHDPQKLAKVITKFIK